MKHLWSQQSDVQQVECEPVPNHLNFRLDTVARMLEAHRYLGGGRLPPTSGSEE